jgi:hypothetical protein
MMDNTSVKRIEQKRYQIGEIHGEDKTYYTIDIVIYDYVNACTRIKPECEPFAGKLFNSSEEAIEYVKETMKTLVDMLYDITQYPVFQRPF